MGTVDKIWQRDHRTTWGGYPCHPAADAWPLMSDEEFEALVESVRATDGSLDEDPATLGRVGDGPWYLIDGRNRIRALQAIGVEVTEEHFVKREFGNDLEIWAFVHRRNYARRQASPSIMAMQAAILREQIKARLDGKPARIRGATPPLNMTPEEEEEWMRTAPDAPLTGPLFAAVLPEPLTEPLTEPETTDDPDPPAPCPEPAEPPSDAPTAVQTDPPAPTTDSQQTPTKAPSRKPRINKPNQPKNKGKTKAGHVAGKKKVSIATVLAAEATGVPERSIHRAAMVLEHGVPELTHAVLNGTVNTTLASRAIKLLAHDQQRDLARTGVWPDDVPKVGNGKRTKAKRGRPLGPKQPYEEGILFAFQEAQRQLKHKRPNAVASMGIDALLGHIDMLVRRINNGAEGVGDHSGGEADLHLLMTAVTRFVALRYAERTRKANNDTENTNT